ncbi:unnamed protein product [Zymoseptoria tritici ST99CH_3D7]|uniref:Nitrogen regulatory protein areA GATA-like domain-containing protein n=3 Tax=Zymoseptoria tritici TaxID=1047171 RepID=F9WWS0_ZYMTI|nr:uncharacterized protein MYCGRDRAFT_102692 [Zymoseptoria tritici IPO323]EGP92145.1 hypothetical protein MYCGRDRAFT_102692 [Zymoseptoria tritici IPO323]SMQ46327.1 unnamed protein product [Zymoseptoria tritici ST99CH_3D7]SMR42673.1 unnamed protein product [Zymoseptoria tritici ST99CH_1E4]
MTEVLNIPRHPDGQSYYENSGMRHESPTSSSLFLDTRSLSSSPKPSSTPHAEHQERLFKSASSPSLSPSNASSYTSISNATSTASSVASDTSIDTDISFPNYDDVPYSHDDGVYSMASSETICEDSNDDRTESTTTDTTRSDSPLLTPTVADDTAIKEQPSQQVDFLSHDWREEDIWSSWRHIVSQRKSVYGEKSRLENASWRTWAKTKFDLETVSPERLNWLKESDVTWLYGPLKLAPSYPISVGRVCDHESPLSKNNSFVHKKPILKKRSVSEVMLQKSISSSSLVKQAAASVQAQGRRVRGTGTSLDAVDSKLQSETPSRDQLDYFTSRTSSSGGTPCESQEKRHIRFDDRVEQCIAVDLSKDPGIDEDESEDELDHARALGSDSSSDEGVVMMKRKKQSPGTKRPGPSTGTGSRSNSASRKIIETLPSTTLKYRTDSPDVTEDAQHHTFGRTWGINSKLSPSPSQETLRPAHPSSNFLLADDDDDDDVNSDSSWSFGASNPKSSLGASVPGTSSRTRRGTMYAAQSDYEVEGMRRTSSGMFMPYDDEDEDDAVAAGLFGRVSETYNTAKDIAHVIWNVGWRK